VSGPRRARVSVRDGDAGHVSAAYMSALPYREANRSQSADRSDFVLKIEHRVVYP
jgi:hypothetical protein